MFTVHYPGRSTLFYRTPWKVLHDMQLLPTTRVSADIVICFSRCRMLLCIMPSSQVMQSTSLTIVTLSWVITVSGMARGFQDRVAQPKSLAGAGAGP